MLFRQFIGGEHKAIGDDSTYGAWHETSPESFHAILDPDRFRAIDEATIGHEAFILAELSGTGDL